MNDRSRIDPNGTLERQLSEKRAHFDRTDSYSVQEYSIMNVNGIVVEGAERCRLFEGLILFWS